MNALAEQFKQLMDRLRSLLLEALQRIEESALFERLVSEYEGLELRQQKWIQATLALVLLSCMALLFIYPVFNVLTEKRTLDRSRRLVIDMRAFQDQLAVVHKPAPRSQGVQPLPMTNETEADESIKQFIASIGLGSAADIKNDAPGSWQITIPELSIRQALAITFQVDGWFPSIRNDRMKISISPDNKELVAMELQIHFTGPLTYQPPAPGTPLDTPVESSTEAEPPTFNAPPPTPGANLPIPNNYPNPDMPPPMPMEDFNSDMPPPTFEEDM